MSWQSILKSDFTIKTNFPDADFWLQRKGSDKTVGKPKEKYDEDAMRLNTASKHDIGIKVHGDIDKEHVLEYLWNTYNKRHWEVHSYGTLNLKHIRVDDVKKILESFEDKADYKDVTSDKIEKIYNKWLKDSKLISQLLMSSNSLIREGREIKRFLEKMEDMR